MKFLTFIRHGQITPCNTQNMLLDKSDLSSLGIETVKKSGENLKGQNFNAIIAADSIRTRSTALILQKYLNVPVIIEPLLNAWKASKTKEFISPDEYWNAYSEFVSSNGISKTADWENFEELKERTTKGIQNYIKFDSILVVSHSIIISLFTGIDRDGIPFGIPKTLKFAELKCSPPDFKSALS